jgi:hypothetical protein
LIGSENLERATENRTPNYDKIVPNLMKRCVLKVFEASDFLYPKKTSTIWSCLLSFNQKRIIFIGRKWVVY